MARVFSSMRDVYRAADCDEDRPAPTVSSRRRPLSFSLAPDDPSFDLAFSIRRFLPRTAEKTRTETAAAAEADGGVAKRKGREKEAGEWGDIKRLSAADACEGIWQSLPTASERRRQCWRPRRMEKIERGKTSTSVVE